MTKKTNRFILKKHKTIIVVIAKTGGTQVKKRTCHQCEHHYFDIYGNICKADDEVGLNTKDFDPKERAEGCEKFKERKMEECQECGIFADTFYEGLCPLCLSDKYNDPRD